MSSRPADPQPSITCPRCERTSYNLSDIEQGYCGFCCWWTSDPQLMHVLECPAEGCHFMAMDEDLLSQSAHMTKMHPEIVAERQAEAARWDGWVND
jgi:hypothetical protein